MRTPQLSTLLPFCLLSVNTKASNNIVCYINNLVRLWVLESAGYGFSTYLSTLTVMDKKNGAGMAIEASESTVSLSVFS